MNEHRVEHGVAVALTVALVGLVWMAANQAVALAESHRRHKAREGSSHARTQAVSGGSYEELAALQSEWEEKIAALTDQEERNLSAEDEEARIRCDNLEKSIERTGETPLLDELRRRYGDVKRFEKGERFVGLGIWRGFSLADGQALFSLDDSASAHPSQDLVVTFFNRHGLVTGVAKCRTGAADRAEGDRPDTVEIRRRIRSVSCPMRLGDPEYYAVSRKDVVE